MTVKLPQPVGAYFAAANAHDADRVADCFAADAVVRDEGVDSRGRDAVRDWAETTSRRYRPQAEVLAVAEVADRIVVTARVAGDFPGSPVDLRYRFQLAGRQIAGLEIS